MSVPGDDGGDCLRCGTTTVQIGHGQGVIGVNCPHCNLTVTLTGDAMTVQEARQKYDNEDHDTKQANERHTADAWGPDPMP